MIFLGDNKIKSMEPISIVNLNNLEKLDLMGNVCINQLFPGVLIKERAATSLMECSYDPMRDCFELLRNVDNRMYSPVSNPLEHEFLIHLGKSEQLRDDLNDQILIAHIQEKSLSLAIAKYTEEAEELSRQIDELVKSGSSHKAPVRIFTLVVILGFSQLVL
jgi:hypothetical protein